MAAGDKHLARHPHSGGVRLALARAADQAGYLESAVFEYEQTSRLLPNNAKLLRFLGRAYREVGEVHKALACFERLRQMKPEDREATRESQQLAAQGAILSAGWAEAQDYREVIRDEEEATKLEASQRVVRTAEDVDHAIDRLQEQLEEEPEEPHLYLRLGDLHKQRGNFDEANEAFQRALALDRTNFTIRIKIGDLKLDKLQRQMQELEAELEKAPQDANLSAQLQQAQEKLKSARLEEYGHRVKARPTDTGLKFTLGRFLLEDGQTDAAIAQFQQVIGDVHYQTRALNYLGQCFANKEMYDMAESQFKRAQDLCETFGGQAKEIAYNLGQTYERMGDLQRAEVEYRKIYERDIGFRDVAQKVEALYKKRREESQSS